MPITHDYSYSQPPRGGFVRHNSPDMSRHPSSFSRPRPQTPPPPPNSQDTTMGAGTRMYTSPTGWSSSSSGGGESRADIIARVKKEQQQRSPLLQSSLDRTVPPPPGAFDIFPNNNNNNTEYSSNSSHRPLASPFQEPAARQPYQQQHNDGPPFACREAAAAALSSSNNLESGSLIERPRSALHTGDFRSQDSSARQSPDSPRPFSFLEARHAQQNEAAADAPPFNPFAFSSSPTRIPSSNVDLSRTPMLPSISTAFGRSRAISQSSLSGSLVYQPPTSPLAQQSNSYDEDFDNLSRQRSRSPDRSAARRHTFSPRSFQTFMANDAGSGGGQFQNLDSLAVPSSMRREATHPYPTHHHPRRSLGSFSAMQPLSTNSSPYPRRPRQPSFTSDSSPLQRAPMVGRYEESILRGRMSTLPSRPLNFLAEIGVLGRGNCKPSLKCPPHVLIPFPAVFYNYGNPKETSRNAEASGPSPYVGLVDIENSLPNFGSATQPSISRLQRSPSPCGSDKDAHGRGAEADPVNNVGVGVGLSGGGSQKRHRHRRCKLKGGSSSSSGGSGVLKKPPNGSYRIPPQGQLQIVIKNPNKTAVKLFLIPYDLSGMEPGQKTFVRQRSYSAGPIIDMPLSSRHNYGTDRPEAAISHSEDPNDRPVLRYLVHVNICCPAKGRFYLYKSIRVVFANRVPDGKEKLRNEIQLPEPRFSLYKPDSDTSTPTSTTTTAAAATSTVSAATASNMTMTMKQPNLMSQLVNESSSSSLQAQAQARSGHAPMHWPPNYPLSSPNYTLGINYPLGTNYPSSPNYTLSTNYTSPNYTWEVSQSPRGQAAHEDSGRMLIDSAGGSGDLDMSPRTSSLSPIYKSSATATATSRDGAAYKEGGATSKDGGVVPRQTLSFAKIDTSRPGSGRSDSSSMSSSGQGLLAMQFQDLAKVGDHRHHHQS